MHSYDWNGLRNRRIVAFAGIAVIVPGSCVAALGDRFCTAWLVGSALFAVSLILIGSWPCPRCGRGFARRRWFPFVSPFGGTCENCGLPEFAPDDATAPPATAPVQFKPERKEGFVEGLGRTLTTLGGGGLSLIAVGWMVSAVVQSEAFGMTVFALSLWAGVILVPLSIVGWILWVVGSPRRSEPKGPDADPPTSA